MRIINYCFYAMGLLLFALACGEPANNDLPVITENNMELDSPSIAEEEVTTPPEEENGFPYSNDELVEYLYPYAQTDESSSSVDMYFHYEWVNSETLYRLSEVKTELIPLDDTDNTWLVTLTWEAEDDIEGMLTELFVVHPQPDAIEIVARTGFNDPFIYGGGTQRYQTPTYGSIYDLGASKAIGMHQFSYHGASGTEDEVLVLFALEGDTLQWVHNTVLRSGDFCLDLTVDDTETIREYFESDENYCPSESPPREEYEQTIRTIQLADPNTEGWNDVVVVTSVYTVDEHYMATVEQSSETYTWLQGKYKAADE